jgi:hypothetical protein
MLTDRQSVVADDPDIVRHAPPQIAQRADPLIAVTSEPATIPSGISDKVSSFCLTSA